MQPHRLPQRGRASAACAESTPGWLAEAKSTIVGLLLTASSQVFLSLLSLLRSLRLSILFIGPLPLLVSCFISEWGADVSRDVRVPDRPSLFTKQFPSSSGLTSRAKPSFSHTVVCMLGQRLTRIYSIYTGFSFTVLPSIQTFEIKVLQCKLFFLSSSSGFHVF